MMDKMIYLDNAATTRQSDEVSEAILNAMREDYFNPSALYNASARISQSIGEKRQNILHELGAPSGELYFTSGGTESNNLALFGARKRKGSRIIVGEGEHDSVYNAAMELKNQGYDVQFAPIDIDGSVNIEKYKALLSEDVSLISIMHASNETGAINDIATLVRLAHKLAPNAIFHSDGVQAFKKTDVNLSALGVDLYTIAAHKIYGPKGIGALYVKKGVSVKPMLYGGGQEKGMRSGTTNYPLICGFERAAMLPNDSERIAEYRQKLLEGISGLQNIKIVTPLENSVSNILTVAFDVRGEVLLHCLEDYGILVGTGSACSSHKESRFKRLLGLDEKHKDGVIRLSISKYNDIIEVETVVNAIAACLDKLRI